MSGRRRLPEINPRTVARAREVHDGERFCQRPDRDEPRIICGYPLPCPHHTIVLDLGDLGLDDARPAVRLTEEGRRFLRTWRGKAKR